ncbi:MAG: WYL domain-containing protein [Rikenellaceae bacterium]
MATNKHATIRYQALDKCFSNFGRKFFIEDLIDACASAIYDFTGIADGVKRRQIFDDITFMESEEGYSIPLARHKDGLKTYYRYEDKEFSINQQPLSRSESEQLQSTMLMLSRFKGLPQFDWLEESLARFETNFKLEHQDAENIVFFEQNPYLRGLEHFSGLFSATISHQPLSIEYHPAFGQVRSYTIHPYALKQHASRWYIVGLSVVEGAENRLRIFAIDRVERFEALTVDFIPNHILDLEDYFDDILGVTINVETKPERIRLKVDSRSYNFISTKPLHHSQKLVSSGDRYVIVELKIAYNYELETALLEFADSVEILEPQHLRDRIRERAERIVLTNSKAL